MNEWLPVRDNTFTKKLRRLCSGRLVCSGLIPEKAKELRKSSSVSIVKDMPGVEYVVTQDWATFFIFEKTIYKVI